MLLISCSHNRTSINPKCRHFLHVTKFSYFKTIDLRERNGWRNSVCDNVVKRTGKKKKITKDSKLRKKKKSHLNKLYRILEFVRFIN